jgi:uroporphyrinogen decarboxylase
MTGRERMWTTLRFEEPDRPPHFEQMFELVEEAFGWSFPTEQELAESRGRERERCLERCVDLYTRIVDRFQWDALCVWRPWSGPAVLELLPRLKRALGDRILLGGFIGGATWAIEVVQDYTQFAVDLYERPDLLHAGAQEKSDRAIAWGQQLVEAGADFVDFPSDWGFNSGSFLSPRHFAEFVTPYLCRNVAALKEAGAIVLLHSDGDLKEILDDILTAEAHILQSIDPMAGMDIREVKRLTYGRIALMGNVQCSLLQDGPDEALAASVRYCLEHGAPGGGYIFSSSNTIFHGLPLRNYEFMLEVFRGKEIRKLGN